MNIYIDNLMQHISYELHTIVKNWTDTLSSQTKPEVVCARKDISDEYLPFSVFYFSYSLYNNLMLNLVSFYLNPVILIKKEGLLCVKEK